MFEAEKTLKQNAAAGDKNPGLIPRNWELMVKTPSGEEKVLKKSAVSYCLGADGIAFSNGKFIIADAAAAKAHIATKLIFCKI